MPFKDHLERENFIALLRKLGHPEDKDALAAAREIAHRMKEAGADWAALLAPTGVVHAQMHDDATGQEGEPGHVHAGDEDREAAEAVQEAAPEAGPAAGPLGDTAGDLALIERLLAGQVSADTREMLEDLKEDIKEGEFSPADRRYLKSLEARLAGARKK
jgi:hypothetical protein